MRLFRICIILIFSIIFISKQEDVLAQITPEWGMKVDYSKSYIPNQNHISDGYVYLLFDNQINLITNEYYYRLSLKVTEENGLSEVSSITIDYDSEYQSMKFNHVHIIRNKKIVDVLSLQKPEILRREQDLEKGITDGDLTCYLEVNDLRVGDVLEYSYIIKGSNPIKKDFLFRKYNLAFSVPVGKINVSFVTNEENKYTYRLTNGAKEPNIKRKNGVSRFIWQTINPEVISHEDSEPSWYDPYPKIYFYTKSSWNLLAKHMLALYTSEQGVCQEIKDLLEEYQKRYDTKEKQVREIIRYVQNNIRYLGNENGIYGYKPRHPNVIINKKSGDCKEKSWLLCTILRELGCESYPMLVNTDIGYRLGEYPASLESFDHCVVCLINKEDTIFIDPTVSNQGGDLTNICFPNYHKGLIISENTTGLTKIPYKNTKETELFETFDIENLSGDAELHVKTIYRGTEAEYQRSYFKNTSYQNMQSGYLEFYANIYPKIDTIKILYTEDYIGKNEFVVHEAYKLEDIWQATDSTKPYDITTYFYAKSLKQLLYMDIDPQRQGPMYLSINRNFKQTIIVNLPKSWDLDDENESVVGPGFEFNRTVRYRNKKLTLDYVHKINKSFITKDEYSKYVEKNEKVRDQLSYGIISYGSSDPDNPNGPFVPIVVIIAILIATIGFFIAQKYYFYNPQVPSLYINSQTPVGGWLVLPAIGITITPIVMIVTLFSNGFFYYEGWGGLINPSASNYSIGHSLIIFGEFTFNILFIVFSLLANVLFHFRRSSTPHVMIAFYVSNSLFIIMDSILVSMLNVDTEVNFQREIIRAIVRMAIWVPYFMKSERVKKTFTRRLK